VSNVLDSRPSDLTARWGTGVDVEITVAVTDADGAPLEGVTPAIYLGGPANAVEPLDDADADYTGTGGTGGVWTIAVPGQDAGSHRLRVTLDDEVVAVGFAEVGALGSRAAPTTALTIAGGSVTLALSVAAVVNTGGDGTAEIAVEDDGVEIVDAVGTINFTGAGVTVSDEGSGVVDVDIPGGGGGPVAWGDVTDKPLEFPPEDHDHAIADVTGLQAALDGKSATGHGHAIADVTGLQTALDGKAATSHNHSAADLTSGTLPAGRIAGTQTDGYVPKLVSGVPTWSAPSAPSVANWYQTGNWSTLQGLTETIIGNGGTIAPGAGVLLLWRIMPVAPVQVSGCQFLTGTGGGGGSTARIGIFAATTGGPTGSPLCTSTAIDVSGTGITSETGWTPATLSAWTVYYGAIFSSSATWALRAMTAVGQNNVLNAALLEAPTPSAGVASGSYMQWRQSTSYGSLPSIGTAVQPSGTTSVPAIAWKVSPV
jgi:hypothetical protein